MPKGERFQIEQDQREVEGMTDANMQKMIDVGYISNAFEFDNATKTGIFSLSIDPAEWRKTIKDNDDPIAASEPDKREKEFIFLVDRSGSMSGRCMENAKKALELALKSLPENCLFNIYSFGSRYTHFFQRAVVYNPNNSASAIEHVRAGVGNLGSRDPRSRFFANESQSPIPSPQNQIPIPDPRFSKLYPNPSNFQSRIPIPDPGNPGKFSQIPEKFENPNFFRELLGDKSTWPGPNMTR